MISLDNVYQELVSEVGPFALSNEETPTIFFSFKLHTKTVIHFFNYCTFLRTRILCVSISNVHICWYVFIRNQTGPDEDGTATEQTGIHRVKLNEGCCFSFKFS